MNEERAEVGGANLEKLLDCLKDFIEEDLKDYQLPVKQDGWEGQPPERPAEVHEMTMPEPDEEHERIPYILLQLLNGKDERGSDGQMPDHVAGADGGGERDRKQKLPYAHDARHVGARGADEPKEAGPQQHDPRKAVPRRVHHDAGSKQPCGAFHAPDPRAAGRRDRPLPSERRH